MIELMEKQGKEQKKEQEREEEQGKKKTRIRKNKRELQVTHRFTVKALSHRNSTISLLDPVVIAGEVKFAVEMSLLQPWQKFIDLI